MSRRELAARAIAEADDPRGFDAMNDAYKRQYLRNADAVLAALEPWLIPEKHRHHSETQLPKGSAAWSLRQRDTAMQLARRWRRRFRKSGNPVALEKYRHWVHLARQDNHQALQARREARLLDDTP